MKPLWTKGPERQALKEETKILTTFIPELMRDEAQRLFPKASLDPERGVASDRPYGDEKEIEHEGAPEDQVPELSPAEETQGTIDSQESTITLCERQDPQEEP